MLLFFKILRFFSFILYQIRQKNANYANKMKPPHPSAQPNTPTSTHPTTLYAYLQHALPMRQPYHRPSLRSSVGGYLYTSPSRVLPTTHEHLHAALHTPSPPHIAHHAPHTSHGTSHTHSPPHTGYTPHHTTYHPPTSRAAVCQRHTYAGSPRLRSAATVGRITRHPPTPRAGGTRITLRIAKNKRRAASRPPYTRKIVC